MKYKYTRKEAIELARNKGYGLTSLGLLLLKQEDKKECQHNLKKTPTDCYCVKCYQHFFDFTPSLLNDIETIEELEGCDVGIDTVFGAEGEKINLLIKNQRILTEIIKSLLIK